MVLDIMKIRGSVVLAMLLLTTVANAGSRGGAFAFASPRSNAAVSSNTALSSNAALDHYLVEFTGDAASFRSALESIGGRVESMWDAIRVASISGLTDTQLDAFSKNSFVTRLARDVSVHWVNAISTNLNVHVQAEAENTRSMSPPSGAEFYDIQWGLHQIGAPSAWKHTRGSKAVRVGILDTGISPDHVDLKGKYDLDASRNFSSSNPGDQKDYVDRHYHGTHVSALIASNNFGVASVAPDVTLVGVKVLDDNGNAAFADLIAGIMYAVDFARVDVINLSVGGVGLLTESHHLAEILHRAIDYAASHGIVVVAAAGNDGTDLSSENMRSFITMDEDATIFVSASALAAEDGSETRACYSNHGKGLITLAAPGGSIDCKENSYANLSNMVISAMAPAIAHRLGLRNPDGWYMFSSGTSMAAPIVSGVAALVKSAHPQLSAAAIVARLKKTADDLGSPGRDGEFGYGRVNAEKALR